jgi:hypothetical protein
LKLSIVSAWHVRKYLGPQLLGKCDGVIDGATEVAGVHKHFVAANGLDVVRVLRRKAGQGLITAEFAEKAKCMKFSN